MSQVKQNDIYEVTKDLKDGFIESATDNLRCLKVELDYFKGLYRRELFNGKSNYRLTLEIINNLKDRIKDEQAELKRFNSMPVITRQV